MLIVMGHTGNRTPEKATSSYTPRDAEKKLPAPSKHLVEILSELHDLLEDYSPVWYTEEHHRRLESALHTPKKH